MPGDFIIIGIEIPSYTWFCFYYRITMHGLRDIELTFDEALSLLQESEKEVNDLVTEINTLQTPPAPVTVSTPVSIKVKYDMGWQKRSSGRSYNSLSGVGSMIGDESGKVIGYDVKNKNCRICMHAEHEKRSPRPYECHKNFCGCSKAMEAQLCWELVNIVEDKGVQIGTLVMDKDSTTIARIRGELSHDIEKWSDFMNVKKHVSGAVFKLQSKHKTLTTDVVKYLLKCFSYAVTQNKGNIDGMRKDVLTIVSHAFGEHKGRGKWCGFVRKGSSYKHKTLTRDLSAEKLRNDLQGIFVSIADNADKIALCATTCQNESFNAMVCSKAPKSRHYSSSCSLNTRVDAAVAQKTLEWVMSVRCSS